jgi:deoxyribodipyrimidine photo-lyase
MAEALSLPSERLARLQAVRAAFPELDGPDCPTPGGRSAALERLQLIDPVAYDRSRNYLDGAVTGLSPYIRHGCVTLTEARARALSVVPAQRAYKFIFELAWRDFWRRVWKSLGPAIRKDVEKPKVALGHAPLPDDIRTGMTGLPCMDASVRALVDTGYVHNHARMWFAAYCIHFRKLSWRACADWYHGHLIDGDLASNHLSWQWVASTFGAKPYIFNRENIAKYSGNRWCATCTAQCPFHDSYPALSQKLFGSLEP